MVVMRAITCGIYQLSCVSFLAYHNIHIHILCDVARRNVKYTPYACTPVCPLNRATLDDYIKYCASGPELAAAKRLLAASLTTMYYMIDSGGRPYSVKWWS